MGLGIVNTWYIFVPLPFEVQMVTIFISHDTLPGHLHEEPIGWQLRIPWQGGNCVTFANTVNWGNLLVTIFAAPSQDRWHFKLMFYPFKTLHHRNAIAQSAAPYFANIAPYQLATGTVPMPNGTNDRPVSCAGNKTYHNCRAVSVNNGRGATMINCTLYTYSLAPGGLLS